TDLQYKPLTVATSEPLAGSFTRTGEGVRGILDLSPGRLDFGQVSTAVKASKVLYLRSVGYSDCTVTAMRGPIGSAGFGLPSPPPLPLTLAVGMEIPVQVDFQPPSAGSASATLEIDSNDSTETT